MKTFYLIIVCLLFCGHMFGRIRNGYESDLEKSHASLQRLNSVLLQDRTIPASKRLILKSRIETLITYITCYTLTEELIDRFRQVAPDIFNELDNITDRRGRPTDVYIKMVPRDKSRTDLHAASFFKQSLIDEDANHSEHGDHSVSIDVWIDDNALFLLGHEFGHVKYIVPNLSNYVKFYEQRYSRSRIPTGFHGHGAGDQSGKCALLYEKKFMASKKIYAENGGIKHESFTTLYTRHRRDIKNLVEADHLAFANEK